MENLIKKFNDFINDEENETLIIQFSSLDVKLYDNGNDRIINKNLQYYSVYIVKNHFFGTLLFWFIDGGEILFCLVAKASEFPKNGNKEKIEILQFEKLGADPVSGKNIIIDENSINVTALVRGNRSLVDVTYLKQIYYMPVKYILKNETVDVEKIMNENIKKQNCYVATLAYGDINHPQVELLRNYRDDTLSKSFFGKIFITIYYKISPTTVKLLMPFDRINYLIRTALDCLILKICKQ